MERPIVTTTVTRPWNWGIVLVSDPLLGGEIPAVDPGCAVSANESGLAILVVHAQDVDYHLEAGLAEASVTTRLLVKPAEEDESHRVIYRGILRTPSGKLSIGDAEGEVVVPAHHGSTHVVVYVSLHDDVPPTRVLLDLSPRA